MLAATILLTLSSLILIIDNIIKKNISKNDATFLIINTLLILYNYYMTWASNN